MKLPERIYVKKEKDGDVEYLTAAELPEDICEENSSITVGEYVFSRIVKIKNTTSIQ